MSFNPKNLNYESNEPAFLRRLREEHGNDDSSRHVRPLARPKKQAEEEEKEDQPVYMIEGSQDTLLKTEYEALIAANLAGQQTANQVSAPAGVRHDIAEPDPDKNEMSREVAPGKQQVANIGVSTKRRLPKMFGEEVEEEKDDEAGDEKSNLRKQNPKTGAKKRKKLKLSFDSEA